MSENSDFQFFDTLLCGLRMLKEDCGTVRQKPDDDVSGCVHKFQYRSLFFFTYLLKGPVTDVTDAPQS